VRLRTTADQYQRGHEFPGWSTALSGVTALSTWTTTADRADFDHARLTLGSGPAVLRDYVKSMKHHWDEAMFIPDLGDADRAWAVACRFRQLRDDEFTGGFVLRRFERYTSAEVRTWWVKGGRRRPAGHRSASALRLRRGRPRAEHCLQPLP
jgi:hypothetical protein